MCTIQLRLNSLVAQCKIYEFQLGDAEYEITITALTNYVHIPDGVFLVMMQATREQQ